MVLGFEMRLGGSALLPNLGGAEVRVAFLVDSQTK